MTSLETPTFIGKSRPVTELTDRVQALRQLSLIGGAAALVFGLLSIVIGLQVQTWPYGLVGAASGLVLLTSALGYSMSRTERLSRAAWIVLAGIALGLPLLAGAVSQTGVVLAVTGALLMPSFIRLAFSQSDYRRALYVAIASGLIALFVDLYSPAGRLIIPIPALVLTVVNLLLAGLALYRVVREFPRFELRTKLIVGFITVSLVPLALLAFLSNQSTRQALRQEANDKLFGASAQTAEALDDFVENRKSEITAQANFRVFRDYLSLPASRRAGSSHEDEALDFLSVLTRAEAGDIQSLAVLDNSGRNLLDSDETGTGGDESEAIYFQQAVETEAAYVSPPQISSMEGGAPSIYFSHAIRDEGGDFLGVLRARYLLAAIQSRIQENTGLVGEDSFVVVFDEHYIHVAHTAAPETIMKAAGPLTPQTEDELIAAHRLPDLPSEQLTTNLPELVERLEAAADNPFFEAEDVATGPRVNQVAVAPMESLPWLVAFFQPQDVLFAPVEAQARGTLLLATLLAGVVGVVALAVAQLVSQPITRLTTAAQRISEGELDIEVLADSEDELGMLARTFNSMAYRLQSLVQGLEERVSERTEDLERRASQLQAASQVAKDAAVERDVDHLMNEAVQRISSQFGYYHAAVFLVDDEEEFAVLRAASSPGGRRMLARDHKLAVGKVGIVGYVTGTGKPRVANDVGEDAVHFANPDLPDTRSELALPLLVRDDIVGALDVQSAEPQAFDEQDVIALQTMADQLAIALENARLLHRQTELAEDRRRAIDVYRQLTGSLSYDQILSDVSRLVRATFGYDRVTLGLVEGNEVVIRSASARTQARLPRLGQGLPIGQGILGRAVSSGRPVVQEPPIEGADPRIDPALGELDTSLCVPLISRGEAIGALAVERSEAKRFDENDVELIELLASQAAVSIENARLFEETQQRLRQVDALYKRQTSEAWELLVNARRVQGQENLAEFGSSDADRSAASESPLEAPISLRGEIIGKLDVLPQRSEGWTEEEIEILNDVAEEVAGQLEQLRLVEEIQRRATQLETAAEIARVATGLLDLNSLLKRGVSLIRERFGFYHVAVYLVEPGGHTAFIREASGEIGEALKQTRRRFEIGSRSVVGYVTGNGEYYVAHDTETDPYYKPSNLLPDSRSELAVPLKIGERIIGALDVHDSGRYAFSEDDIVVLETLADQIAVAVENARLFQEAVSRAEREQSVVQITSKIRQSRDIDSMMQTAVQEMRQVLGARSAVVRLATAPAEPGGNGKPMGGESSKDAGPGVASALESEPDEA